MGHSDHNGLVIDYSGMSHCDRKAAAPWVVGSCNLDGAMLAWWHRCKLRLWIDRDANQGWDDHEGSDWCGRIIVVEVAEIKAISMQAVHVEAALTATATTHIQVTAMVAGTCCGGHGRGTGRTRRISTKLSARARAERPRSNVSSSSGHGGTALAK
jgi:hypothetical protein